MAAGAMGIDEFCLGRSCRMRGEPKTQFWGDLYHLQDKQQEEPAKTTEKEVVRKGGGESEGRGQGTDKFQEESNG